MGLELSPDVDRQEVERLLASTMGLAHMVDKLAVPEQEHDYGTCSAERSTSDSTARAHGLRSLPDRVWGRTE